MRKSRTKINSFKKLKSFGVGGNTPNPKSPNTHGSAMAKDVPAKPNTQIMGFNGSIPTR